MLAQPRIAAPAADAHKYSRGLVAVVAGVMPGAAALCAEAAARAGAGYVRLMGEGQQALVCHAIVRSNSLDFDRAKAVLVGPGLGRTVEARDRLESALASGIPVVADADALFFLADESGRALPAPAIMTPHEGEFNRLFGEISGNKIERTRAGAKTAGSVVVHKGADTVIAAPDGRCVVASPASPWLSSAGTGDVLAGLLRGAARCHRRCLSCGLRSRLAARRGGAPVGLRLRRGRSCAQHSSSPRESALASDADLVMRIAARGDGITGDGRHVPGSAPGDRLLPGGGLAKGPIMSRPSATTSRNRGGCQLQQLSDGAYADYVRDRVAGALTGQGIGADEIAEAHISPPYSRRRASLLGVLRLGKSIQIGFSTQASHRIVDMHECHVLEPRLFALVAPLRVLFASMLGKERAGTIDLTLVDQGVDVILTGISPQGLEQTEALLDFARDHALARLMIDGEDGPLTLWEPDPVTITFGALPVSFPPRAFLQATADGEAALIAEVRAGLADAKMVADLFAGLGTFALTVADDVPGRKVHAAEAARTHVLALQSGGNRLPGRIFHRASRPVPSAAHTRAN